MPGQKPPVRVQLEWQGGEAFTGTVGNRTFTLDGNGNTALSPMQLVAAGVAGCMAVDVATILTKGRHRLQALSVRLDGHRADGPPARYTSIELRFVVAGDVPRDAVERAIALSRDKYCSAWHSLRQDIALDVQFEIVTGG